MTDIQKYYRARRFYAGEPGAGAGIRPAHTALAFARRDLESGRKVYSAPLADGRPAQFIAGAWDGSERWIDNPARIGLRPMGAAHDIAHLRHTGYYVDEHCAELARGHVFRLTGRRGLARYVAAVQCPHNPDSFLIDFDVIHGARIDYHGDAREDARDAARAADDMAERFAEREREYSAAWSAGARHQDSVEEERALAREVLAILRERRALDGAQTPALCAALRARVASFLEERAAMREERADLRAEHTARRPDPDAREHQRRAWDIWVTFCDGAGIPA